MKPISNRGRDYLVILRQGPQTESQLRRATAELTDAGRSHEGYHSGRRPSVTKVLPGLIERGAVIEVEGVYSLTQHGVDVAAEIVHVDHHRRKSQRERRRAVQLEDVIKSYGQQPPLPRGSGGCGT